MCVCVFGRNEVRSSFNLWSTLLAETRKMSRERASLAETLAAEMVARLEIMAKDVHILTKKVGLCPQLMGEGVLGRWCGWGANCYSVYSGAAVFV